ncbi:unnamed protein product [Blepharisma stoltei]|uniref:LITAF domain-containing protein n=1 Tax=Blepharisma stoltei TaxID=1481888 RepID=A0AAU9JFQ2_9CILI|nr:unnamed protein product [Blepharisma stoltei]
METLDRNQSFEISPLREPHYSKLLSMKSSYKNFIVDKKRKLSQNSSIEIENVSNKENEMTKEDSVSQFGFSIENILPSPNTESLKPNSIGRILSYNKNQRFVSLSSIIPAQNKEFSQINKIVDRNLVRSLQNFEIQEKQSRNASFSDENSYINENINPNIFELGYYETKTSTDSYIQNLDILGVSPCACFCRTCEVLVNSEISLKEERGVKGVFLNFLYKTMGCCSNPIWIQKKLVHRCEVCKSILGYVS